MGKGIINFDAETTNWLLEIIENSKNRFPFDTSPVEGSSKGITSGALSEALKDVSSKMKGYFLTEEDLRSVYITADEGSKAYVGYNYPYSIYLYESSKGGWYDTKQTGGDDTFNTGDFYTKLQVDQKFIDLTDRFTETDNVISNLSVNVDAISKQIGYIGSTLDEINSEKL